MTDNDKPRLELSLTQIVASALAAMTAAVLASYLGVAGTVIGAAVFSIIGTSGSAIYSHSIRRTKARLRRTLVMPVHPGKAPSHAPTGVAAPGPEAIDVSEGAAGAARAAWAAAAAAARDAERGAAQHEAAEREEKKEPAAEVPAGTPSEDGDVVEETRVLGERTRVGDPAHARSAVVEETEQTARRPVHWKSVAIAAATVFVVAMAGITVLEAIAGRSVPALVHGNTHGSRFWFEPGHRTSPTPTPTTSGSPSPTATATPTGTPSAQPSASAPGAPAPVPSPTGLSPTPTAPPSQSPSPAPSLSATPTESPSGPAGSPSAPAQQGSGSVGEGSVGQGSVGQRSVGQGSVS
jgi:hypothetical protein